MVWPTMIPSRLGSSLSLLAALAGSALLGLALVELVYAFILPLEADDPQTPRLETGGARVDADHSILWTTNLFGAAVEDAPAQEVAIRDDLPETTLRLALKGVTPTPNGVSRALIETSNGQQKVVVEGETIQPGAVLIKVETWRAVINRSGSLEALLLQNRPEISAETNPAIPVVPAPEPEVVTDEDAPGDAADRPGAGLPGDVSLAMLAGNAFPVLESQGFLPTDVPLAVDGEPFPSDQAGLATLLRSAAAKGQITVTVSREGEEREISFSIPQGGNF